MADLSYRQSAQPCRECAPDTHAEHARQLVGMGSGTTAESDDPLAAQFDIARAIAQHLGQCLPMFVEQIEQSVVR